MSQVHSSGSHYPDSHQSSPHQIGPQQTGSHSSVCLYRFAPDRFAPGPMRYPPIKFHSGGRAIGVPQETPVRIAPVSSAPDRSAFVRIAPDRSAFVRIRTSQACICQVRTRTNQVREHLVHNATAPDMVSFYTSQPDIRQVRTRRLCIEQDRSAPDRSTRQGQRFASRIRIKSNATFALDRVSHYVRYRSIRIHQIAQNRFACDRFCTRQVRTRARARSALPIRKVAPATRLTAPVRSVHPRHRMVPHHTAGQSDNRTPDRFARIAPARGDTAGSTPR